MAVKGFEATDLASILVFVYVLPGVLFQELNRYKFSATFSDILLK